MRSRVGAGAHRGPGGGGLSRHGSQRQGGRRQRGCAVAAQAAQRDAHSPPSPQALQRAHSPQHQRALCNTHRTRAESLSTRLDNTALLRIIPNRCML
ncbi:unnamed protein product [Euphydryas editha]|uniref:Uncharacterized protein n=1 Tax=Euphydryas editha TaxID=104508 RepID=A0AAU9U1L0_EUPED|nr:unnamed protein product [Euphydryas editha]